MHVTDRKTDIRLPVGTEFFFSPSPTGLGPTQPLFWRCQKLFPSELSGHSVKLTTHSILKGYHDGLLRLSITRTIPTVLVVRILSIVSYAKKRHDFGYWIYFRPQVKGWGAPT
jgi:hypothetical protein